MFVQMHWVLNGNKPSSLAKASKVMIEPFCDPTVKWTYRHHINDFSVE